jgi:ribosomal protein S27E
MGNLKEKVAYLQGLTQGLNVGTQSAEGKLILNIIEVLDDVAEEFHSMYTMQQDLENYVETIDEDLTELEDEIYEESPHNGDYVEMKCPSCHEVVTFESEVIDDNEAIEVTCPYCGDVVYDNTVDVDSEVLVDDQIGADLKRAIHPGV